MNINGTKIWTLVRQLLLGLSGAGVLASFVTAEQLLAIVEAVDKFVPLIGEGISLVIFIGTTIYGLFFSKPAVSAAVLEKKDAA